MAYKKIPLRQLDLTAGISVTGTSKGDTGVNGDEDGIIIDFSALNSDITSEETARTNADSVLQTAIDNVQTDVDQNESDGDTDRQAIRSEFAAADLTLTNAINTVEGSVGLSAAGAFSTIPVGANGIIDMSGEANLRAAVLKLGGDADAAIQVNVDDISANSGDIGDLQTEMTATQSGAGLDSNGDYPGTNISGRDYISGATSLDDADDLLSQAIKVNEDAIAAETSARQTAITNALASEMSFRGSMDASAADPFNGATIAKGDMWVVTVAGSKLDEELEAGDMVIANVAGAQIGQTPIEFSYVQKNLEDHVTLTYVDAEILAVQNDVDQNESDGDVDRAAIRSEFAAADSTLETAINKVEAQVGLAVNGDFTAPSAEAEGVIDMSGAASLQAALELLGDQADAAIDTNITDISTHTTQIGTLSTDLDAAELDIDALETDVAALQGSVAGNRGFNWYGEVTLNTNNAPATGHPALVFNGSGTNSQILAGVTISADKFFAQSMGSNTESESMPKIQLFLNGVLLEGGISTVDVQDNAFAASFTGDYALCDVVGQGGNSLKIGFIEGLLEDKDQLVIYFSYDDT